MQASPRIQASRYVLRSSLCIRTRQNAIHTRQVRALEPKWLRNGCATVISIDELGEQARACTPAPVTTVARRYTNVHTHMHTYMRTYKRTRRYAPQYMHTYVRTYTHTCKHTYTYTYIRAYIHTYITYIYYVGGD